MERPRVIDEDESPQGLVVDLSVLLAWDGNGEVDSATTRRGIAVEAFPFFCFDFFFFDSF